MAQREIEEDYWNLKKESIEKAYPDGTNKLNESIVFDDIVALYPNSTEASFKVESLEGDQSLKIRRARCFMFIQSFENFFGKNKAQLLKTELQWFDELPVYQKFLSPSALEKSWAQRHKVEPLISLDQFLTNGSPMAKFCWALKYDMPGKFLWIGGSQEGFFKWAKAYGGPTDNLPSCALINCWEMVFYAAIKAGLLAAERVIEAYKAKGDTTKELQLAFAEKMRLCFIVKGRLTMLKEEMKSGADLVEQAVEAVRKLQKDGMESMNFVPHALKAGDIIVVQAFLENRDEPIFIDEDTGHFSHVAAVIDGGDNLDEIKITSLWESPPTTATHSIKPILATVDLETNKLGTKQVMCFFILRL